MIMDQSGKTREKHTTSARRSACPECGTGSQEVSEQTIVRHLSTPASWEPSAARHYFCANPGCDTVYFGDDGSRIPRAMLHTRVGIKDDDSASLLCYCFKLSRADFEGNANLLRFVSKKTRAGECSCESSNPSGRCCLKELPR